MTTWVLIIMMWGSGKAVTDIPVQSQEACLAAKTFYNKFYATDASCLNTETGEVIK